MTDQPPTVLPADADSSDARAAAAAADAAARELRAHGLNPRLLVIRAIVDGGDGPRRHLAHDYAHAEDPARA